MRILDWLKSRRALLSELQETKDDARDLQRTFDLRWKADRRATKLWQEAHPGNDLVWPDHADMVVWLMEELDKWREPAEVTIRRIRDEWPDLKDIQHEERNICAKCGECYAHDGKFGTTCDRDECKFSTRPRLIDHA